MKAQLARLAGMLCGKAAFQQFAGVTSADDAAAWIRQQCEVESRRELDTDDQAAQRFHERVRRPYLRATGE